MSDYWLTHVYHRLSVKGFVEEFAGWTPLKELVEYASPGRDRGFLCAMFCSGGRASEVLSLAAENFDYMLEQNLMLVRNMRLVKRYKKLSETLDAEGHKRWVTELKPSIRKPFPILNEEPLAQILLDYLKDKHGLLFPSPYVADRPLTRSWAYKMIRYIDTILPDPLREKLGINKPFIIDGQKLDDHIHLWLHWFRSQRASQLVYDYGYELLDLIDYFSWERQDTALVYARKGWRGLASKMQAVKIHYV